MPGSKTVSRQYQFIQNPEERKQTDVRWCYSSFFSLSTASSRHATSGVCSFGTCCDWSNHQKWRNEMRSSPAKWNQSFAYSFAGVAPSVHEEYARLDTRLHDESLMIHWWTVPIQLCNLVANCKQANTKFSWDVDVRPVMIAITFTT